MMNAPQAEPFKIKVVEPIKMTTREYRMAAMKEAGYNTYLLKSEDVYIDLLTDSGTSAMSDSQWAGMMLGDEAYAGSRNFFNMEKAVQEVYGFKYVIPTHQGRGAEHILSKCAIRQGDYIPGNMYFPSTRVHQELAGGTFVDIIVDEAHEPDVNHPFKGNVDLSKLEKLIAEVGAKRIPYIHIATCVNMAGGQPISMANLAGLRELCNKYKLRIVLDNTRTVENAYFIKEREPGFQNKSIKEIVREICSHADAVTMSCKKDSLVNIGGFLAMNDEHFYRKAQSLCIIYEGLHTYGGLAGRDMEAVARGIYESVADDFHIAWRIEQVQYLGERLIRAGIPIVLPVGGHGIFIDAKKFLSHVSQDKFPAETLAAALYVESGVRGMESGTVSAGRDKKTGEHKYPKLELLRLAIPRRVYTNSHMNVVADAVIKLYDKRKALKGLKMTFEPEEMRFFHARFENL